MIPKGFQWKWTVQLDATAEEEKRCMKVREDAALKLIDLSRMICSRKCDDLQLEIQACSSMVCYEDRSEIQRWAIAEKDSISCLKAKKFFMLRKSNRSLSSHTQSDYRVVGIEKDGNCFFRCLSQLIHGTQMKHEVLTPSVPQGHFWATRTTTLSATGPLLGHWFAG